MRGAGSLALLLAWLSAAPAAPAAGVAEKLAPCLACHGAQGQSAAANVPSLGAQQAPYLIIQLFLFREGMRLAAPMNDMAKGLSDNDLQAMASALSAFPAPRPPVDPGDAARLARAGTLIGQNHCNVCHRPDFSGQANVPRLANQRQDYLLKSLRDYKSGARHGYDATMAEVVEPLDDPQFVELSYYLAHFR
jgi:cytochrome c553